MGWLGVRRLWIRGVPPPSLRGYTLAYVPRHSRSIHAYPGWVHRLHHIQFGIDALLARSSDGKLSQDLLEGLFSRSVSGLNGSIEDR